MCFLLFLVFCYKKTSIHQMRMKSTRQEYYKKNRIHFFIYHYFCYQYPAVSAFSFSCHLLRPLVFLIVVVVIHIVVFWGFRLLQNSLQGVWINVQVFVYVFFFRKHKVQFEVRTTSFREIIIVWRKQFMDFFLKSGFSIPLSHLVDGLPVLKCY